jgi:hypothetical protein
MTGKQYDWGAPQSFQTYIVIAGRSRGQSDSRKLALRLGWI